MQILFALNVVAAVCTCVAIVYPANSADTVTGRTMRYIPSCSDDLLGYRCRHACTCSQNTGRLLCPTPLPGTDIPGKQCSMEGSLPAAE
ncbi:hypothetical protein BC939DRAFT_450524 [Gamsiella multidivaricata]|uniref:uncharacterized protein n=1 Tax=Gamsiella multidivaricata TaxID=101098 RepID=UPI00221F59E7|nr:uncharacterized protein BC939DRAFT_450524 [Gamsiella multidivaricata]KAI7824089.1 hypothetical protein BC939DRAFT_450524 [Gamsiella multidivaricata]